MSTSRFDQMRKRLGVSRRPRRRSASESVLLVALGAAAGVALGMVIADRAGGISGLLRKAGVRRDDPRTGSGNGQEGLPGWRRGEHRSERFDEMKDDDSELSPESIAHMHVQGEEGNDAPLPEWATRGVRRDDGEHEGGHDARAFDRGSDASDDVRHLPVRHAPDEAELEARVLEAFINDPILSERAIDICASGTGTIELTGWVHDSGEIGHALTLARGVPDVSSVVDRLAVRGVSPARDHSGFRYAGPPPGSDAPRAD